MLTRLELRVLELEPEVDPEQVHEAFLEQNVL